MGVKAAIKRADARAGGRMRRFYQRNFILGGGWGEFMDALITVPDGAMVLDLGAGEADLRTRFPNARYIAIDRGIGHGGWDYSHLDVVSDATQIPFDAETFDLIICKQVLEHISEPVTLLKEARRVLRPGGLLLLSTNQSWPQHQQPYDFFRFTSYGLRYCFEQANFEVEQLTAMGGAFTAAMFHNSQTLAPHLWAKGRGGQRFVSILFRPLAWLMRLAAPLVNALDRLDKTKDNTLGWYVAGRAHDEVYLDQRRSNFKAEQAKIPSRKRER